MSYELRNTLEILFTIVLPLLILYLRGNWPLRTGVLCLLSLPPLWYLTYAPLHELSHVAGTYLVGGTVVDYKLIPRFWLGQFGRAWITTIGLPYDWHQLVSTSAPYVFDLLCLGLSIRILRQGPSKSPFVIGLVFMFLCLRPAFDVVCETLAFLMNDKGHIYHICQLSGDLFTWSFILFSLGLSAISIAIVLIRFRRETASSASAAT